ncbi:MAG: hypothetical protein HQK88_07305 [Nitrospirae bacterium]|nr:hypothetical protein [Nitrospirota bacterium]MBF0536544.1 hypothetical protein [Nitrospirota bacterium]MBF0616609.1 hypothetical protein [Nitrospirota bacterium]
MIQIDALAFYFILELIGILLIIIGVMYVAVKRYRKKSNDKNFENLLMKDIESLENQIKVFDDKTAVHFDKEAIISNEIDSTKLNLANTALEALHSKKDTMESFWYHLFDGNVDKIMKGRFNHFLTAASSFMSKGLTLEEQQKLKDALSSQKRETIKLLGYKDMFVHVVKEFRKIRNTSETIAKSLEKTDTKSNEINKAISDCKLLNSELDRCVEVLITQQEETSNDGAESNLSFGDESNEQSTAMDISSQHINPEIARKIEGLQKSKKLSEDKIKELEEIIKKKEDDYNNIENDYNQLQVEYMNVFKQHKGETGWASKAS